MFPLRAHLESEGHRPALAAYVVRWRGRGLGCVNGVLRIGLWGGSCAVRKGFLTALANACDSYCVLLDGLDQVRDVTLGNEECVGWWVFQRLEVFGVA